MSNESAVSTNINEHAFACAKLLKGECNEAEIKNFIATADFLAREIMHQVAKGWPEALRIARKIGESGDKPTAAKLGISVKLDLANLDLLKVEVKTDVAPWKLQLESSVEEDLRQLTLDFDAFTMTRDESIQFEEEPEQEHSAGPESGGEHPELPASKDYAAMDFPSLKKLAKSREIKVNKLSTAEDLVAALEAQDEASGRPPNVTDIASAAA